MQQSLATNRLFFPKIRQSLIARELPLVPLLNVVPDDRDQESIIVWSSLHTVEATHFQEVTLWEAPRETPRSTPNILSLSAERTEDVVADNGHSSGNRSHNRVWLRFVLLGIMVVSLMVMASVVIPDLYYRIQPESVAEVTGDQLGSKPEIIEPVATPQPTPALPPVDPSLPLGDWLRIPTIGVNAGILATANPDEALEKGAWMVPDFGRPDDFTQPTIIASHRYGWVWWWKSDFGRKNSFYYLPQTEPGDIIEVVADQRRFTYQIYAKEEGTAIDDYQADLILYTCKFLNSPQRYFVYAKRVASV